MKSQRSAEDRIMLFKPEQNDAARMARFDITLKPSCFWQVLNYGQSIFEGKNSQCQRSHRAVQTRTKCCKNGSRSSKAQHASSPCRPVRFRHSAACTGQPGLCTSSRQGLPVCAALAAGHWGHLGTRASPKLHLHYLLCCCWSILQGKPEMQFVNWLSQKSPCKTMPCMCRRCCWVLDNLGPLLAPSYIFTICCAAVGAYFKASLQILQTSELHETKGRIDIKDCQI